MINIPKNIKNQKILDEFLKLVEQIKYSISNAIDRRTALANTFRLKQINNSINVIKSYPSEITSGEQLRGIKGIGKGTISRINEILKNGKLSEIKIQEEEKKFVDQVNSLQEVIGIGPRTAYELVTKYKIKTVEELKEAYKKGKIELNREILLGLKYYGILQVDIPREEITLIDNYLMDKVKAVDKDLIYVICGSYRRQKPTSSDIDVLLAHPKALILDNIKNSYLRQLILLLKKDKFIVDDITDKDFEVKYMGLCQFTEKNKIYPVRRIDIRLFPYESYFTALLHFTGSVVFNERIRGLAKELGYKLNEYGLFKKQGDKLISVPINSEEDVFQKLGLEYIPPENR